MITNTIQSKFKSRFSSISRYVLWSILTIFTLGPIYWMFVVSSRAPVEVYDKPNLVIDSFYVENYLKVFDDRVVRTYMVNSLIIATTNAALVTTLALFATYALTRWKLKGSDSIFFWTITNIMAPPAAFILPNFFS